MLGSLLSCLSGIGEPGDTHLLMFRVEIACAVLC